MPVSAASLQPVIVVAGNGRLAWSLHRNGRSGEQVMQTLVGVAATNDTSQTRDEWKLLL